MHLNFSYNKHKFHREATNLLPHFTIVWYFQSNHLHPWTCTQRYMPSSSSILQNDLDLFSKFQLLLLQFKDELKIRKIGNCHQKCRHQSRRLSDSHFIDFFCATSFDLPYQNGSVWQSDNCSRYHSLHDPLFHSHARSCYIAQVPPHLFPFAILLRCRSLFHGRLGMELSTDRFFAI